MANSIYHINKGINKSIEFKGLKAQYIWYLGGGLVCMVILFAVMYICGISNWICIPVVLGGGTLLFMRVYGMSKKYGEHGMMKAAARRALPAFIKSNSRKVFMIKKDK